MLIKLTRHATVNKDVTHFVLDSVPSGKALTSSPLKKLQNFD
jgi:hypothetical protein